MTFHVLGQTCFRPNSHLDRDGDGVGCEKDPR
ncbi:excalibur calcium-binding domain-containing protein [Corynebacterium riegelii]|nr:hypothetical protein CYJ48_11860 [Corynebacterium riegelii]QQU85246.1 excalibur calcium-binding domain-containing protein [Corynebacterium riegelii]